MENKAFIYYVFIYYFLAQKVTSATKLSFSFLCN